MCDNLHIWAAAVLTLSRAADEEQAVKSIPWNTIIMVGGVTVLISILEKTGGNKYQAAQVLGFDRKTLYRKLAEIEEKGAK
mgnify:CR=1 FL=1